VSDENHINIIGPFVRRLRKERGWSLERLAHEFAHNGIRVSSQTLERVELQQEIITEYEILAFAAVFQTSVNNLFPDDATNPDSRKERQVVEHNTRYMQDAQGFLQAGTTIPARSRKGKPG
jgi:transcriptional regulator with XRE-family HTH domain